jgi:hypothetical protein
MTTPLIIGGIALAGMWALSQVRGDDADEAAIDAAARAAIAAKDAEIKVLLPALQEAEEQGDDALVVEIIGAITTKETEKSDIAADAKVDKNESKQRKKETETTQTKTFTDPEIARQANDKQAYNDAVRKMRASPELSVYFKVPPYEYGNWRGQMNTAILDAEDTHLDALEKMALKEDKFKYDSQLGAYRNSLIAGGIDPDVYFRPYPYDPEGWQAGLRQSWEDAVTDYQAAQKPPAPTGKTAEQLSQEAYAKFRLDTDALLAERYPAGSSIMYWEELGWFMGWETDPDFNREYQERYGEAALLGLEAQQDLARAQAVQIAQAGPRSQASLMDEARFQQARTAAIAQWGDDFVAPAYIEGLWESYMAQEIEAASGKYTDRVMAERRLTAQQQQAEQQLAQQAILDHQAALELDQALRDAYNDRKADLYDEFPEERGIIDANMTGYRSDWENYQGQLRTELVNVTYEKEQAAREADAADRSNFATTRSSLMSQYPAGRGQLNQWTYSPDWRNEQFDEKRAAQDTQRESDRREQDRINQQARLEEEYYQQQLADQRQQALDQQRAEQQRLRDAADAAQEAGGYDLSFGWWQGDPSDDEPRFGGGDQGDGDDDGGSQVSEEEGGDQFDFSGDYDFSSAADVAAAHAEEEWADAFFDDVEDYGYGGYYGGDEDE